MPSMPLVPMSLTAADVMQDLEAGRSLPLRQAGRSRSPSLGSLRRPTLGGRRFVAILLAAKVLGRIRPRLARRPLERLWYTPWPHPSTRRPIQHTPADLVAWSLPAQGRTLRGFAGGVGPTVVLVHGWAGRAADWRHLAADLIAAGWHVVAPDLPAHGMTDGRTTDMFELGRALATVLRRERPAAVVTHSLGFPLTLLAIDDGAEAPDVVVALAPGRKALHALDRFAAQTGLGPGLAGELRRAVADRFGADVWEVLDVDPQVRGLNARGVVVHDTDDEDVPIADGHRIATDWPEARFVATEGLGHRRILRDGRVRALVVDALG